jgi:uncharacterized repeat protein (TIGR02543 family)
VATFRADGTRSFVIAADTTLYAVWGKDSHTVTYYGNGNTGGTVPAQLTYTHGTVGVTAAGQGTLMREDHTFLGWTADPAYDGVTHAAGAPLELTDDISLYAVWQYIPPYVPPIDTSTDPPAVVTFGVSYNGNGNTSGSVPIDGNAYSEGSAVNVLGAGSLVREGYAFTGWSTNRNAMTAAYAAGNRFTIRSNVTLFAVWQENTPPAGGVTDPPQSIEQPGNNNDGNNGNAPDGSNAPDNSTDTNISIATGNGLGSGDQTKLDAQTGNLFSDIGNGNVPLGGFFTDGAWSLISLLLSLLALVIAALTIVGIVSKRRAELLKLVTIALGFATTIVWLILDDMSKPMVWFNQSTLYILLIVLAQVALIFFARHRQGMESYDATAE